MARQRMIKPAFWTSEQVVECSPTARLLFIGLWNFCDDGGNHPASIKTLKMEIFPGDDISLDAVQKLLDELIQQGLVVEYATGGKSYWHVTGWHHQKIEKPTYLHPPFDDRSTTPRRLSGDSSATVRPEEKRREVKRKEEKGNKEKTDAKASDVPSEAGDEKLSLARLVKPNCPHQAIINLYHEILPMCPQVRIWTPTRADQLRARWNEDHERQNLDHWREFFEYVSRVDFLCGRSKPSGGGQRFVADLEWLTKLENFTKVIEGKYEKRGAA